MDCRPQTERGEAGDPTFLILHLQGQLGPRACLSSPPVICDIPHDGSLLWGAYQGDQTEQTFGDLKLAVYFAWVPLLLPGLGCVGVLRTEVRHICHRARLVSKHTGCKTIGRRGAGRSTSPGGTGLT